MDGETEMHQKQAPTEQVTQGEKSPVVIIGAGPAGLAVAACLNRAGIENIVLEKEQTVAHTWRNHYDRLHLHTTKRHSTLPYHKYPKNIPRYPSRQHFVDYLEEYARTFNIQPRFETEVHRASHHGSDWVLETHNGSFRSTNLVVASGYNRIPQIPEFRGLERFEGEVLHSSAYKNGAPFKGKRVLVIGCGNSGAEIALDLHEHGAETSLVVRNPIHVAPRDVLGNPSQNTNILLNKLPVGVADTIATTILRLIVGDLSPYGIHRPKEGPNAQILKYGRIPLIDVGTIAHIKSGEISVRTGVERFTETWVVFEDEKAEAYDAVIMATGYRSGLEEFMDDAQSLLNERGYPRTFGEEMQDGLFFIGFRNPPTGNIRETHIEAKRIVAAIKGKQKRLSS
jgi:indole-3-pyruvate monooxygenase